VSLTGLGLQLLLFGMTLVAIAGAVWLMPMAGRRWISRLGLLVPAQVLGLLAVLAVANATFSFYTSWDDLLGRSPKLPSFAASAHGGRAPTVIPVSSGFVDDHQMLHGQGKLESVIIRGERSGIRTPAFVFLPQEYLTQPARRFPVLVALTGYPGDERNLVTQMRLPQEVNTLVSERRVQPMIIVMMRPMVTPPRDTECTDVPGAHQPQAETFFGVDLPAALGTAFRTAPGPAGWGMMGDSTGGYCSTKITMRYSDHYSAAISLAGYYSSIQDLTTGDLYDGNKAIKDANNILWRMKHLPQPPVNLLLTSSKVGESDYKQTMQMVRLAKPPLQISTMILPEGGHHFSVWRQELPGSLTWLSQHLTVTASS
jgi:enterochelin esterase-like enzyme